MHLHPGRRSIRLPGYDYRRAGWYFVTVCALRRDGLDPHPFGEVVGGRVRLTERGRIIEASWQALATRYTFAALDAFVVMPDHMHGLLGIQDTVPLEARRPLGRLVGAFKTVAVNRIAGAEDVVAPPVWQRGYHERIVRSDVAFANVRRYIVKNPARWSRAPTGNRAGRMRAAQFPKL
ncbi:MAG: transposase [Bacteroidota bacterium]